MRKLLLLLVMTFPVGENFDVQGFLDACKTKNILLYASTTADSPHGHIILDGNALTVTLYEKAKAPSTFRAGRKKIQVAGNAILAGPLASHKSKIQAAIAANDAP